MIEWPVIRLAETADLPAILEIYNYEIRHATSTFDTDPVTLEERRSWLAHHDTPRHPAIVAETDPMAGMSGGSDSDSDGAEVPRIAGFGSLSAWSQRCAYARAAEVSVYVHRDARRMGIGRAILGELITRARAAGIAVLLARICAEGEASLRLHEALGFQSIGSMRRVGEKFGRILDIELYDLHLDGDSVP